MNIKNKLKRKIKKIKLKKKHKKILILSSIFLGIFLIFTITFYFGFEEKSVDLSYSNWNHNINSDDIKFIQYGNGIRVIDYDDVNVAFGQINFFDVIYGEIRFNMKTINVANDGHIYIQFRHNSQLVFQIYRVDGIIYLDIQGFMPIEFFDDDYQWHTYSAKWSFETLQLSVGFDDNPVVDLVDLPELNSINNIRIETNPTESDSGTDFLFLYLKNLER